MYLYEYKWLCSIANLQLDGPFYGACLAAATLLLSLAKQASCLLELGIVEV
uniref:Uncharacterized protein n=1 Tax=Solanum tuberosum TaxID=4113 RepID=M0ZX95_SOLTU